ncbi:MAG: glycerol-3-phosphate 1-O-acyltransferase PlsY [Pseudomonadota bacterium]
MLPIESDLIWLITAAFVGYLSGSIPFGLLLSKLMGLGDLRSIGSGNIGATNVLRTGNKVAAFLTLVLDALKGAAPLLLFRHYFGEDAGQLAGLAAFIGHLYPVWLQFKGGKGVATFLGVLLALSFPVGAMACLIWLIGAAITRMSSVGSLSAATLSPMVAFFLFPVGALCCVAMGILVWVRHEENIRRVMNGSEPKIGR